MALNVKAAVLICTAFIGGISWVVQQIEAPQVEVASPLMAGTAPLALGRATNVAGMAMVAGDIERRAEWARRFDRPNALDAQAELNRSAADSLAVLPPPEPLPHDLAPPPLPPLVYDPGDAVASLEQTQTELAPEGDDQHLLAGVDVEGDEVSSSFSMGEVKRYRVARGDTLSKIARREWDSDDRRLVRLLVKANPKVGERDKHRILAGEELLIPDTVTAQQVLVGESLGPKRSPTDGGVVEASAVPDKQQQWYTIRRNDTLASIARRFLKDGRRWREIVALNHALDPHRIFPGTRIKLPPVIRVAHR